MRSSEQLFIYLEKDHLLRKFILSSEILINSSFNNLNRSKFPLEYKGPHLKIKRNLHSMLAEKKFKHGSFKKFCVSALGKFSVEISSNVIFFKPLTRVYANFAK